MKEIKIFKLKTGEEIIANVEEAIDGVTNKKVWNVEQPCFVAYVEDPKAPGRAKIHFLKTLPMADKPEIVIRDEDVLYPYSPSAELLNHYSERYGSGITVVKGVILTE